MSLPGRDRTTSNGRSTESLSARALDSLPPHTEHQRKRGDQRVSWGSTRGVGSPQDLQSADDGKTTCPKKTLSTGGSAAPTPIVRATQMAYPPILATGAITQTELSLGGIAVVGTYPPLPSATTFQQLYLQIYLRPPQWTAGPPIPQMISIPSEGAASCVHASPALSSSASASGSTPVIDSTF